MDAPFSMVDNLWSMAKHGDAAGLEKHIPDRCVIYIDGRKYTSADFVKRFASFGCAHYILNNFTVLYSDAQAAQAVFEADVYTGPASKPVFAERYCAAITFAGTDPDDSVVFIIAQKSIRE